MHRVSIKADLGLSAPNPRIASLHKSNLGLLKKNGASKGMHPTREAHCSISRIVMVVDILRAYAYHENFNTGVH